MKRKFSLGKMLCKIRKEGAHLIVKNKMLYKLCHMFNSAIEIGQFEGLFDYCSKQGGVIEIYDDSDKIGRAPAKDIFELENETKFQKVDSYKIYVAKLSDAYVYPQSDVILKNNLLLTDRVAFDSHCYTRYLPEWIKSADKPNGLYIVAHDVEVIPKGISLVKMWSHNWFHFLFESIARLQYVDKLDMYDDYPILLDEVLFNDERNVEIINIFNIKHRPIIKVSKGKAYYVEDLIVPSLFSWLMWDVDKLNAGIGWAIDKAGANYLRDTVLNAVQVDKKNPISKLYVTRGNNARMENELETAEWFREKGFTIINPSDLTLQQEVEYFSNADYVVSVMGAALTNIVFCKKSVTIFEICPFEFQYDSFAMIADAVGIDNYHRIHADVVKNGEQINETIIRISQKKYEEILCRCEGILERTK